MVTLLSNYLNIMQGYHMLETRVCLTCNIEKSLAKFGRNYNRGKSYGYRSKCNWCYTQKYDPWIKKPLGENVYDCRFKWEIASEEDKITHTWLVFNSHAIKKDGCWEWDGCKDKNGYGDMTYEKRPMKGHRVSWMLHFGKIPEKMLVLHICDNTSCTNPEHLFLGTAKDNRQDCLRKGRMPIRRGADCNFTKLKEDQVREIKKLLAQGKTQTSIANEYNVTRGCISDINLGRNWKHIEI